jgi:hypothetical protein
MQALTDMLSNDAERRNSNSAAAKDFLDVLRKPITFITICLLHGPLQAIATTSCKLQGNG